MTVYEVRQCTNPACRLRLPVDLMIHRGKFCPLCGEPLDCVDKIYEHLTSKVEVDLHHREIVVILDNIQSVHNVGSIFRTADGAGTNHIYLCGITPNPVENPAVGKTALGSEKIVPWSSHLNAVDLAKKLITEGYRLFALECVPESVPISHFDVDAEVGHKPLALILGNERAGVDPGLIELCEAVLALPMAGQKASLNVSVAFGVGVYWLAFT